MARLTPKSEALALRIYNYAKPLGWDCTPGEVAEALGVHPVRVGKVARAKGWNTRLRCGGRADWALGPSHMRSVDTSIDGGFYRDILARMVPPKWDGETAQ